MFEEILLNLSYIWKNVWTLERSLSDTTSFIFPLLLLFFFFSLFLNQI